MIIKGKTAENLLVGGSSAVFFMEKVLEKWHPSIYNLPRLALTNTVEKMMVNGMNGGR